MKTIFIAALLLTSTLAAFTHSVPTNQKLQGVVSYEYQDYGPRKIKTYLYFDEKRARYERHGEKETVVTDEGFQFEYGHIYHDWYYEEDSSMLFVEDKRMPNFFAKWKKRQIEWEITDETQRIGGFLAKKAITKPLYYEEDNGGMFHVDYGDAVAWFTTEIPLSYGPDGYNGLPGLILKLEYTGEERILKTTFTGIKYKEVEEWNIPNTRDKLEVTEDQAYNYWNYGEKWFKKKAKKMGID